MKTPYNIAYLIKNYWISALGFAGIVILLAFAINSRAYETPKKTVTIENDHLVNKGDNGFQQRATVTPDSECIDVDDYNCTYNVTPLGKMNIPEKTTYTRTEIDFYESQNWIQAHPDSSPALYDN